MVATMGWACAEISFELVALLWALSADQLPEEVSEEEKSAQR